MLMIVMGALRGALREVVQDFVLQPSAEKRVPLEVFGRSVSLQIDVEWSMAPIVVVVVRQGTDATGLAQC